MWIAPVPNRRGSSSGRTNDASNNSNNNHSNTGSSSNGNRSGTSSGNNGTSGNSTTNSTNNNSTANANGTSGLDRTTVPTATAMKRSTLMGMLSLTSLPPDRKREKSQRIA
jgi:hypothetical protein